MKILLIKKQAVLLLFVIFAFAATNVFAQMQNNERVTLSRKSVSLEQVLKQIDQQSKYAIIFNLEQVNKYNNINVVVDGESVLDAVAIALRDTNLTYELRGTTIVISEKSNAVNSGNGAKKGKISITIDAVDMNNRTPLVGALAGIEQYSVYGITGATGSAVLSNLPAGNITIVVSYVGYKEYSKQFTINSDTTIRVPMVIENLKINDVVVVAQESGIGKASSSKIGRQAIDHMQALSLKDVMELIPGSTFGAIDDLTSPQQLSLRTLNSGKNNANGVAIMVDGVPMSNNANVSQNAYNVVGGGFDLRKISTDDIDNVEVIRGVPSAEYGDLSAGAVIVNRKYGVTPLNVRGKVSPSVLQGSASKGWGLNQSGDVINGSFDYLRSSGDPRVKNESYDRVSSSVAFTKNFGSILSTNTNLSFNSSIDNSKSDPDAVQEGIFIKNKDYSIQFSHKGDIKLNKKFSRTLRYNISVNGGESDYYTTRYVVNSGGQTAIFTSLEDGIYEPIILPPSYFTGGGSKSKPFSTFAKLTNNFYVKTGATNQLFNMGVEYRYEKNNGIGKYNDDNSRPLHATDTRPEVYKDTPALNQLSAFVEDNLTTKIFGMPLKVQAGVRFTSLQPGREEFVWSVSPRINVGFSPAEWLDVTLAYGLNSKTPGMSHLYPDPKYIDRIISTNNSDPSKRFVRYQTYVLEVINSDIKNSTNNRYELGLTFRAPQGRHISFTAYRDENKGGFASASQYLSLGFTHYGTKLDENNNMIMDLENVVKFERIFATNGRIGNTEGSMNTGVEISAELGRIKPIRTNLYLRGAYIHSEAFTTGREYGSPIGYSGPTELVPFKLEYPSGKQKDIKRQFSTQLQAVCNIPVIELVASATVQVIWHTYSKTTNLREVPIAWFDHNLVSNPITAEMLADPEYRIKDILLKDQIRDQKIKAATINPPVWLMTARLTKNIADFIGVSFYANNMPYYEPWQSSNLSTTKSQRNLGTFGFGLELRVTL